MAQPESTVYIVDDDPVICAALARLFRSVGLASQSFCCAREFLARATNPGRGCLVLDLRLPDSSGLEVQAELARAGIGLPVIFHTAHGSGVLRARALKAGAAGFLDKPAQDQALLSLVFQAMESDREACPATGFRPPD